MIAAMRSARVGFAAILGAGLLALVAAQPAGAIQPFGEFIIHVTDCRTGQPIPSGEVDMSVIHQFAVGVSPIVNGVAGPAGIGANHYRMTILAPGYRRLQRVVKGNGDFSTTTVLDYCLHPINP